MAFTCLVFSLSKNGIFMFESVVERKAFASKIKENLVHDYKLSISRDVVLLPASKFNDILNVTFNSSKCADEATVEIAIKILKAMVDIQDHDSASRLKKRIEASLGYFKGRDGFTDSRVEMLKETLNAVVLG
tara:strand:+ start:2199 stop:2594 length:396 start_codon:yes stop_codon:yes gene_type:complete